MAETTQKYSEGNIGPLSEEEHDQDISKSRKFIVTFWCKEEPIFTEEMKFLAYGAEVCPTTGRHHWQSFLYMKNQKTESALAKYLKKHSAHGTHPRVRYMLGNFEQNTVYCSKESTLIKHGKPPAQGERMDLKEIKKKIFSGTSVENIIEEDPMLYHQYGRTMEKLEDIYLGKRKRTEMTQGIWIYGETGLGKSHEARDMIGDRSSYDVPDDKGWWDGYTGQDVVILDDFRGEIPFNQLLKMIDKWPFSVPRRNRRPMPFTSKEVIITSSMHPLQVFEKNNDNLEQLYRRVRIIHMTEKF